MTFLDWLRGATVPYPPLPALAVDELPPSDGFSAALALGGNRVAPKQVTSWQRLEDTSIEDGCLYAADPQWHDTSIEFDEAWIHVEHQGIYVAHLDAGIVSTYRGIARLAYEGRPVIEWPTDGGDA